MDEDLKTLLILVSTFVLLVALVLVSSARIKYVCDRCEVEVESYNANHYRIGFGYIKSNTVTHHFCDPCELIFKNLMEYPTNTLLLDGE